MIHVSDADFDRAVQAALDALPEDFRPYLENVLIEADLGLDTTERIIETLGKGRYEKGIQADDVRAVLRAEVERALAPVAQALKIDESHKPHVVLVVGVNGTGKTTTIGKLAAKFRSEGKKVVLAAGDTFRAAAIDQLKIWGERTGSNVIARDVGSDAAGGSLGGGGYIPQITA